MMKRILAIVRILVGALFVMVSIMKFRNADFFEPGGLARELTQNGVAFPFYQSILDRYIFPHATVFASLVAAGELIVGLSFLLGAFTNLFSLVAIFMILNFCMAVCYGNIGSLVGHLVFIGVVGLLGVYSAGRTWGVDASLARRLSSRPVFFPYRKQR